MADVTGRIGNEDVELNNAATEATLRLLLQATLATDKKTKENIAAMVKRAGLDPVAVQQANQAVQQTTPQMNALGKSAFFVGATFGQVKDTLDTVWRTGELLASGNAQASQVLTSMATMLPGPLAKVVQGLSLLAAFQEGMLTQYQGLTKAGVNFGGSLTDLRLAASQTYMTMAEFTQLASTNSKTFAKMGGSVNDGAKAFVGISNTLQSSKMGTDLRALGYTAQEVNQGMLDYINISGGRNRKEMQDTATLAQSSAQYMEQLDGLAKLTGDSREELAKKMKEDAANQAWQGYLLTLDEEGRKKAVAAGTEAAARGGTGAAQALQAKLMGLPPMTEAAQRFVGTMQNGNQALDGLADGVKDNTKTIDDVKKAGSGFSAGLAQDGRNLKQVGSAMIMAGKAGEDMTKALGAANTATLNNITTAEEQFTFEQKIAKEGAAQKEAEAAAAVKTKIALEELGQKLLAAFMPVVQIGLKIVNVLAPFAPAIMGIIAAFAVLKAGIIAYRLVSEMSRGGGAAGGAAGAAGSAAGALSGTGPALQGAAAGLRAFANPMVLAGAAGFGVAIAAIGAGLAGAAWLVGKALPTLAEGLMKFTEIDGAKLGSSAFGIGKLGLGLITFAPIAIWGIPAGYALNSLADGVVKLNSVDPAKLEKVAAAMQKVKDAAPSIGQSIATGIAGLVSKVTTVSEPAALAPAASAGSADTQNLVLEIRRLNIISADTLKYIKDVAEYTKRNVDATKNLSGNNF